MFPAYIVTVTRSRQFTFLCNLVSCVHVNKLYNFTCCFSVRTSVWDGTQTSTGTRWSGWWGRSWSAGSLMIWSHRSATLSQPLLSGLGPARPPRCPPTASTPTQTGAAMCEGDSARWRIFYCGKKLLTCSGTSNEVLQRRWQNQTHFTSKT